MTIELPTDLVVAAALTDLRDRVAQMIVPVAFDGTLHPGHAGCVLQSMQTGAVAMQAAIVNEITKQIQAQLAMEDGSG
jgi:hypothetical protein